MTNVKYLKLLRDYPVQLSSGRNDIDATMYFAPYAAANTRAYDEVTDEDMNSSNYNKPLIDHYLKERILTTFYVLVANTTITISKPTDLSALYLVGESILYEALPKTDGFFAGDHTVKWTFDDGLEVSDATDPFTINKVWTTKGNKSVLATATNTKTNTTATATNTIPVATTEFIVNGASEYLHWTGITCSMDGKRVAAVSGDTIENKYVFLSSDYGETWTKKDTGIAGAGYWSDLVGSSNGAILVAARYSGGMYKSSNYGETWTSVATFPNVATMSLGMSGDGTIIASCGVNAENIMVSTNSGTSWTKTGPAQGINHNFTEISVSRDGQTMIVADNLKTTLFVSTNFGASWVEKTSLGSLAFKACHVTKDGSLMVAGVSPGSIYTSTNTGNTWIERTSAGSGNWGYLTGSYDGKILYAVDHNTSGKIHISKDYGVTWTIFEPVGVSFNSVATPDHGLLTMGCQNNGNLWYSDIIY